MRIMHSGKTRPSDLADTSLSTHHNLTKSDEYSDQTVGTIAARTCDTNNWKIALRSLLEPGSKILGILACLVA